MDETGNAEAELESKLTQAFSEASAFMDAIRHDDDAIAILRTHLLVEAFVNEIILAHFPDGAKLLSFLRFTDKVRLIRDEEFVLRNLCTMLDAVNTVRNSFAHLPLKLTFTEDDKKRLLDAVGAGGRKSILENSDIPGLETTPSRIARNCLCFIHGATTVNADLAATIAKAGLAPLSTAYERIRTQRP